MTRERWHRWLLAVVSIAAAFLLAEIALALLAPVPNPYDTLDRLRPQVNQYIRFEYPPHYAAVTTAEPGLPGLSGEHRFTTNNRGFRGDECVSPKPADEFRIFIVGGSTTECFYIDDGEDMSRVLQRELAATAPESVRVKVYNTGYSGAASDDHVAMISQRLVHLEPDLIVVFCGINDLTRSIFDYDYLHYVEFRPVGWKRYAKHMAMRLQVVRRAYYLKQRLHSDPRRFLEERRLSTRYAGHIGYQRTLPVVDDAPRTDTRSYENNLRSIVGLARAHGFRLVFMTQQTTWNSPVDSEARKWSWMRAKVTVTFREDRMDEAMERLNDTMRTVARDSEVPLYDLVRLLPKSLEYFYDDCHFNPAGARWTGRNLAVFLVDQGVAPSVPTENPPGGAE